MSRGVYQRPRNALLQEAVALVDPCGLPDQTKKRSLSERERAVYAPMTDLGGIMLDKDAVYIDLPDWKVRWWAVCSVLGDVSEITNTVEADCGYSQQLSHEITNAIDRFLCVHDSKARCLITTSICHLLLVEA